MSWQRIKCYFGYHNYVSPVWKPIRQPLPDSGETHFSEPYCLCCYHTDWLVFGKFPDLMGRYIRDGHDAGPDHWHWLR